MLISSSVFLCFTLLELLCMIVQNNSHFFSDWALMQPSNSFCLK